MLVAPAKHLEQVAQNRVTSDITATLKQLVMYCINVGTDLFLPQPFSLYKLHNVFHTRASRTTMLRGLA